MRRLLLGAAAISLSGCSFLGFGNASPQYGYSSPSYASTGSGCAPTHAVLANGNCLSRFNIEGGVGLSYHDTVGDRGFVLNGEDGTVATTDVDNVSFNDAYDTAVRYELGASYALSPQTKISAMGHITEADSEGVIDLGTINGADFEGGFSDYKSTGFELGLRRYFNPTPAPFIRSVRPYIEGRVGATYQNAIYLENGSVGGAAVGRAALTESDWVPSAAGLVGIETPLTRYSTIGLETGLRYSGAPDNTDNFAGTALDGTNTGGDRLSIPLMLRGRYRF